MKSFLFLAEFGNGYPFRNMIEHLKSTTNVEGHFVFNKDSITYKEINSDNILMNEVNLRTCDFNRYVFNSDYPIKVGVSLTEFRIFTSRITNKNGFRWYKRNSKDDNHIYCQILSYVPNSRESVNFFLEKHIEDKEIGDPEYIRKTPNATCLISNFSKVCKEFGALKCNYIAIQGYPKGVTFTAVNQGNIAGKTEKFGTLELETKKYPDLSEILKGNNSVNPDISDEQRFQIKRSKELPIIRISSATIKSLVKINNIAHAETLSLYVEENNPMRIMCPIGTYGSLTIHLRNITVEEPIVNNESVDSGKYVYS